MKDRSFFGSATIGDKGQIVIPAEARTALGLDKGDKLLVMGGPGGKSLLLLKPEQIEEFARKLNDRVTKMQSMINQAKDS